MLERFIDWAGLEDERAPVLVAHNASFDVGFLRRAARAAGRHWPKPPVVDTLALARLALPRPARAQPQARDHCIIFRHGDHSGAPRPRRRSRHGGGAARFHRPAHLGGRNGRGRPGGPQQRGPRATPRPSPPSSSEMPTTPGVYHFINASGDTLYVGSASSLRSRVSSYYTRAEKRQKIQRMVSVASGVRTFPTSSILEARIRELRDIASLAPPYNSASRRQACQHWVVRNGHRAIVTPTVALEDLPRALGPFGTRAHATRAANAIARALGEHGSCEVSTLIDEAVAASSLAVPTALTAIMTRLSERGLFESAATVRDELSAYIAGVERATMRPVLAAPRIVWGMRRDTGEPGWLIHAASYGRHVASVVVPPLHRPHSVDQGHDFDDPTRSEWTRGDGRIVGGDSANQRPTVRTRYSLDRVEFSPAVDPASVQPATRGTAARTLGSGNRQSVPFPALLAQACHALEASTQRSMSRTPLPSASAPRARSTAQAHAILEVVPRHRLVQALPGQETGTHVKGNRVTNGIRLPHPTRHHGPRPHCARPHHRRVPRSRTGPCPGIHERRKRPH